MKSMKNVKRAQSGFTLIELMIVVAIIGILAAVAIPQYQSYVVKTKWSRMMTEIDGLKQKIASCMNDNANDGTKCDGFTGSELDAQGITAAPTLADAGAITVTGSAGAAGAPGKVNIAFTGNANVGGYIYNADGTPDASGNNFVWTATATDTIPTSILADTRR